MVDPKLTEKLIEISIRAQYNKTAPQMESLNRAFVRFQEAERRIREKMENQHKKLVSGRPYSANHFGDRISCGGAGSEE